MEPLDYTEKVVITLKESKKIIENEILRAKTLPRMTKGWFKNQREDGVLYMNDPVSNIKGVGKGVQKLLKDNDINTIADLHGLDMQTMNDIAGRTKGLNLASLKRFQMSCALASIDNAPAVVYFIDKDNPYAAKFGTEKDVWGQEVWITKMKKSSAFSGKVCITDLVKHMVRQTKKCYENTMQKDLYHFAHDALSQLNKKCCVEWMMNTTIPGETTRVYKRWVKPENGLNDHFGPKWWRRPIGNSPELMPLDNSLNQDVHESVRRHTVMSLTIRDRDNKDDRLITMTTPKETARSYKRIFDPTTGVAPKSERILQDVNKVVHALQVIYEAEGVYVPGLAGGRTPGGHHTATTEGKKARGGKRTRMEFHQALRYDNILPELWVALVESGGSITHKFASHQLEDADESSEEEEM